ncbi:MAG: transcription termination/antitermination protein NusG [Pirellulaceae bacterium]
MSSQPDSTADNAPDLVSDPADDNSEQSLSQLAEDQAAPEEAVETVAPEDTETEALNAETIPAEDLQDETAEDETAEDETAEDETAEDETAEDETAGTPSEASSEEAENEEPTKQWYILKVQVNREKSIRDALERRTKIEGLEEFFGDIVVPTEEVAEFNRAGKRRIVKKKLFPGYIMAHMIINDDTWFLVRETPGIGDFTGSGGKPTPMDSLEVERILQTNDDVDDGEQQVKTAIPFKTGDRVRVKDGYFLNFEGDVEGVDEANGRVTVMIDIFGRSTPVELEHWQIEDV